MVQGNVTPVLFMTWLVTGWAKTHDVRAAALGGKIPSLRTHESLGLLPCPVIWPVTPSRRLAPNFEATAVLPTAALAVAAAASAGEHQPTIISLFTSYHRILTTGAYRHGDTHSYSIHLPSSLHFLHCHGQLVQEEQGTSAYSVKGAGDAIGAVTMGLSQIPRLPRQARTGYWTAQSPPPTPLPHARAHTHTHTQPSYARSWPGSIKTFMFPRPPPYLNGCGEQARRRRPLRCVLGRSWSSKAALGEKNVVVLRLSAGLIMAPGPSDTTARLSLLTALPT